VSDDGTGSRGAPRAWRAEEYVRISMPASDDASSFVVAPSCIWDRFVSFREFTIARHKDGGPLEGSKDFLLLVR
jgi:hypothetical protein